MECRRCARRLLTGGTLDRRMDERCGVLEHSDRRQPASCRNTSPARTSPSTQPLLRDFGWRFALLVVDVAQIAEEQAFFEYKAEVANLVASVEEAYWIYVLAIENVRVEEKGLDLAKELLRQNQGRFKVGALPRTSVLESEAEVARREAELVRVRALRAHRARQPARADQCPRSERGCPADDRAGRQAHGGGGRARPRAEPAKSATRSAPSWSLHGSTSTGARWSARSPRTACCRASTSSAASGSTASAARIPAPARSPIRPRAARPRSSVTANPQVLGGYGRSLELLTDGRYYQYQFGAVLEVPLANADAKARYAEAKVNAEGARLSLSQLEENVTLEITRSVNNLEGVSESASRRRASRASWRRRTCATSRRATTSAWRRPRT